MKEIKLNFPNTSSGLAGFEYGKREYEKQVAKEYNNFEEELVLIFPNHIKRVASSFVQGFFSELVKDIGYKSIDQQVHIQTENDSLAKQIFERIY